MEAVKAFSVVLDLSDVFLLYDYQNCEYITREPETQWDMDRLTSTGKKKHQEEESLRIKMMDRALFRPPGKGRGFEQTDLGNEDVCEQSLNPSLHKRIVAVYSPGDIIKGNVFLNISKSSEADELKLNFKGVARVDYSYSLESKDLADTCGEEIFVNKDTILWQKYTQKEDCEIFDNLLDIGARSEYLEKGFHKFQFEFVIPEDVVESVPDLIDNAQCAAYITYNLKASLTKKKVLGFDEISTVTGLWVAKPTDIAKIPDALTPFTVEEVMNTGALGSSGDISIRGTIPRKGYIKGETIPVFLVVENCSGQPIEYISARVNLAQRFTTGKGLFDLTHDLSMKGVKVYGEAILGGEVRKILLQVPIHFPTPYVDNNLIPTSDFNRCTLIKGTYEILIKAKRKGLRKDINLKMNFFLGTRNSTEIK